MSDGEGKNLMLERGTREEGGKGRQDKRESEKEAQTMKQTERDGRNVV